MTLENLSISATSNSVEYININNVTWNSERSQKYSPCGEILIKIQHGLSNFQAWKVIHSVERVRYLRKYFSLLYKHMFFFMYKVNGDVPLPAALTLFFFTPRTLMDMAAFLLLYALYILFPYLLTIRKLYFSALFKFLRQFFFGYVFK